MISEVAPATMPAPTTTPDRLRNVEEVALGDCQFQFDVAVFERGGLRADLELHTHDLHEVRSAGSADRCRVEQNTKLGAACGNLRSERIARLVVIGCAMFAAAAAVPCAGVSVSELKPVHVP